MLDISSKALLNFSFLFSDYIVSVSSETKERELRFNSSRKMLVTLN